MTITLIISIMVFLILLSSLLYFIITQIKHGGDVFNKNSENFEKKYNNMEIVEKIHNNLFNNFEKTTEMSERIGIINNLKPNDVVLEIGGNIGGVSEVIASILKNPKNLVVVEPNKKGCEYLQKLMEKNNKIINIFNGVIYDGINKLECEQPASESGYCDCKPNQNSSTINKTFLEIENMFKLQFNVLVIDCEGCYENIFNYLENKDILKRIDKIFIEWDGKFQENFLEKNNFILVDYIQHPNLDNGVRTYINKNTKL